MKKLMIAAATAALAGATFAANVYDYKASVKYVDFKKVTVQKQKVDVKTVKSATLKGYLVTPIGCGCNDGQDGLNPAFLIVQNNKNYGPKVLPANLLSKVWETSLTSKTLQSDGYLFAGVMDRTPGNYVQIPSAAYDFGDDTTTASEHLFGAYNEANKNGIFVEAWLTHAGFGKATRSSYTNKGEGCKKDETTTDVCLTSLSGSVVGGSFTCEPNGMDSETGLTQVLKEGFLCQGWNKASGNEEYLVNVVSGTWSIKANDKIAAVALTDAEGDLINNLTNDDGEATTELGYLKACGQKLQKGYVLTQVGDAFAAKWF